MKKQVNHTRDKIRHLLVQDFKLPVHAEENASHNGTFIGLDLVDGRMLRIKTTRLWRLQAAVNALLARRVVSGALLQVL